MVTKEDLCAMLEFFSDDPLDIDQAWATFQKFEEYIADGDIETIKYFTTLMMFKEKDILGLRTRMAEQGFELTPSQLSQYIFILSACLLDSYKLFKEKKDNIE
jgi:hypothetical protein